MATKIPRLFELIEKNNLNQKQFSQATGITQGNISDWKNGKSKPAADKLIAIADYFDISIDYLLGRTGFSEVNKGNQTVQNVDVSEKDNLNTNLSSAMLEFFSKLDTVDQATVLKTVVEMCSADKYKQKKDM